MDRDRQRYAATIDRVRYTNVIEALQGAEIGKLPLQKVRASDLEAHYATAKGSASTLGLHHTVLSRALRKAKRDNLITANPIPDVETRPRRKRALEAARENCWSQEEARSFSPPRRNQAHRLRHSTRSRSRRACERGNSAGLPGNTWISRAGRSSVERQLSKGGEEPIYGPPKNGRPRTITDHAIHGGSSEGAQAQSGRTEDGESNHVP